MPCSENDEPKDKTSEALKYYGLVNADLNDFIKKYPKVTIDHILLSEKVYDSLFFLGLTYYGNHYASKDELFFYSDAHRKEIRLVKSSEVKGMTIIPKGKLSGVIYG